MPPFNNSWKRFLGCAYVDRWREKARRLYEQAGQQVYPEQDNVFRAFNECPLDCLKVVIVGEAPYDNGDADGLAFSVRDGASVPSSLWIVFSKVMRELDVDVQHTNGNLVRWAQQGVLLLNSRLTIRQSPDNIEWEDFTGQVLRKISMQRSDIVFMLWGNIAHKRRKCIVNNNGEHRVLCSSHPSPQGAWRTSHPFVDCEHFSQANEWLGSNAVDWS